MRFEVNFVKDASEFKTQPGQQKVGKILHFLWNELHKIVMT